MQLFKRTISFLLAGVLALSFSACGAASSTSTPAQTSSSQSEVDEKTTLKILTWSNMGSVRAINDLATKYMEKYPNVTVEVTDVDTTQFDSTLATRMQANDVDIITIGNGFVGAQVDWAPTDAPNWQQMVDNGNLLDITDQPWVKNWSTGAAACTYKDRVYAIATGSHATTGVFYNKTLFEENGWEVPATWSEFEALCEDIKAKGMNPMTCGAADNWPFQMLSNALMATTGVDYEEYVKGLWTGDTALNDETGMLVFDRFKYLADNMEPNFMSIAYADVIGRFVAGKAVMLPDGAWQASEFDKIDPNFKYGYFPLPGDEEGVALEGKFDLCFAINANSANQDAALNWMEMLSDKEIYTEFVNTVGFIPTMDGIEITNEFIAGLLPYTKDMGFSYELYTRTPAGTGQYGDGAGFHIQYLTSLGGDIETTKELADLAQKDYADAVKAVLENQ